MVFGRPAFGRFTSALAGAALAVGFVAANMTPSAAAPFAFDTAFGRLPKDVVPVAYSIAVVPNARARTLTGTESIVVNVRSAITRIQFNTLNERLSNVRFDGKAVANVVTANTEQLTTLTLAAPASPGRHTLTFAYTGRIETTPEGLFAQAYRKADGTNGLMLSTQMEATDARRMFPCWDEPSFRATFQLTATVPAAWSTVSNMPIAKRTVTGALAVTTFRRSPKMPSYLVEFSAGALAEVSAHHDGTGFGVWAVAGEESGGATALANAQVILADYNAYFGFRFPLPKLDSIAIPGGFPGAMENWGAITYNDQTLLLNPSSTVENKQTVFSIQAHEMAHQWNGDLVTMGWWDDLWLNESFASWMAAKETDKRNPTWNWLENEDRSKESAMEADARVTSHAIQTHVADELQAQNSFDSDITYSKGQAFLRMMEAYLGESTFRDGIRAYIKARAFSNATGTDLWNALSAASGQDVAAVARAWTEQPGFPLVSVAARCDALGNRTIALSQHRFLLSGSDSKNPHWSIPLDIRSGAKGAPKRTLFTTDGQRVAAGSCSEPLSVNADAVGFYRVAYDARSLGVNQKNFGTLGNGDRIALLDDQWALVRSGKAQLPSYFALASAMGADDDARAWNQITQALGEIERDERGAPGHDAFTAYARSIVKPLAVRLGAAPKPGETPDISTLRRTANRDLGLWGDRDAGDAARRRFAAFVTDRSSIVPDDQADMLAVVAANADAATFDQLHAIAKSSKNETELRRYYRALMSVRNAKLATQALSIALSPEIPPQAVSLRLRLVGIAADENPQLAWRFFKKNSDTLLAPMGVGAAGFISESVPQLYWRGAPLDEIKAWVSSKTAPEMAPRVADGIERAESARAETKTMSTATDTYVGTLHMINAEK